MNIRYKGFGVDGMVDETVIHLSFLSRSTRHKRSRGQCVRQVDVA